MTVRRIKTYTGDSGFVYQYYFVGQRPSLPQAAEGPSTEYVFDVTSDSRTTFSVSVFLRKDAVEAWARLHGRGLTDAERYAAAKMRLLRGFDETLNMLEHGRRLMIDAAVLDDLLAGLGLE
jgi:hypothetical protein